MTKVKQVTEAETCEKFDELCDRILQPHVDGEYIAEVGDWFILASGYHWSIWEKTAMGKERVVNFVGAMNRWDFHCSLLQIEAFLDKLDETRLSREDTVKRSEYQHEYYEANKAKIKEYQCKYRAANKAKNE